MVGHVSHRSDLLHCYRESDILVVPSFTETFGLVYLEAMSQGVPVVYSENQGIDGYYSNGAIGYSCKPSDPADIAESICAVMRRHRELSLTCNEQIVNFTWDKIAQRYEDLYQEVVGIVN